MSRVAFFKGSGFGRALRPGTRNAHASPACDTLSPRRGEGWGEGWLSVNVHEPGDCIAPAFEVWALDDRC